MTILLRRFGATVYKNRRSITVRLLSNSLDNSTIVVQDRVVLLLRQSCSDHEYIGIYKTSIGSFM